MRGFTESEHLIEETDASWTESYFPAARRLLDKPGFQTAVHCLATYRWHTHPRARLALIWAGIEGLFGIESELSFRLSLYAARFLAPGDPAHMKVVFSDVRRLYGKRSAAVHGSRLKGETSTFVDDSAQLLQRLVRRCVVAGHLPRAEELAP